MRRFDHFIITRFNIKSRGWQSDKNGQDILNEEWLKDRFQLFETYCLPTIINQSNKDFYWFIYFDSNTPEYFKNQIDKLLSPLNQARALYVVDYNDFEDRLANDILENSNAPFIITSRLDNDDSYHKDTVKVIQNHFVPKSNTIIDLSNGLTLDVSKDYRLSRKTNVVSGPFVSYIDARSDDKSIKTVYDCEHTLWQDRAEFITVKKGNFWLQIIHSRNMSNQMSQDLSADKSLLKGFPIKDTPIFTVKYYVYVYLLKLGLLKSIRKFKSELS